MKEVINAIAHDETESFLRSIGVLQEVNEGKITCHDGCGTIITTSNFRAVAKVSGKLLFSCDNEDCYRKLIEQTL